MGALGEQSPRATWPDASWGFIVARIGAHDQRAKMAQTSGLMWACPYAGIAERTCLENYWMNLDQALPQAVGMIEQVNS